MLGLWNAYPVTPGHALLVTRRHVADWFTATAEEQFELAASVTAARQAIEAKHQPDGFNVGTNVGEAGGQTVFHLHLHVVPRYSGLRPRSQEETDCLIPGKYHLRLKVRNFVTDLVAQLRGARSFDVMTRLPQPDLLPLQTAMDELSRRGGQVRARIGRVPCEYFRLCDQAGQETVWVGGPDWYYSLLPGIDRDGQRELRKAFEEFWAQGEAEV